VLHDSSTHVAPPSTRPDPTPASTIAPIWSAVSPSVQPDTRQQTPTWICASLTCSQKVPDGHRGELGSQMTRALGIGSTLQPATPSARAIVAAASERTGTRRLGRDTSAFLKTASG
jgi:hypothetical protein